MTFPVLGSLIFSFYLLVLDELMKA